METLLEPATSAACAITFVGVREISSLEIVRSLTRRRTSVLLFTNVVPMATKVRGPGALKVDDDGESRMICGTIDCDGDGVTVFRSGETDEVGVAEYVISKEVSGEAVVEEETVTVAVGVELYVVEGIGAAL